MQRFFVYLIAFVSLTVLTPKTEAQVDLFGVASGRYQVKKSSEAKKIQTKVERKVASEAPTTTQNPAVATEPIKPMPETESEEAANHLPVEPSLSEQVDSLMNAKAENILNFYKEQVHPDDIRNNKVEIEIRPGLIYNDSKANYSYRSYQSFYSGLDVQSNVWVTPLIGLYGKIGFSLAASVSGNSATQSRTAVKYESVDLGFKFRKFFGLSRKANSVELDFVMVDDKMTVPTDDLYRARLRTTGLGFLLSTRLPTSSQFAWVLGSSFYPRLQHMENATGIALSSGTPAESTRIGFDLGGELKFQRESQVIYKLSVSTEKNTFSGTASLNDPETGTTPSNVGVTNTILGFSFGYRWAN